tara:strand:- start:1213 stop:1416 length:204 start_codon:yes stop_codon:yes gene_type:complete
MRIFRELMIILSILFLCSCDVEKILGPNGTCSPDGYVPAGCMDASAENYCSWCTTDECDGPQCVCVY